MRSRQFRQYQILAIVVGLISFGLLSLFTPLNAYVLWLLALSLVTFLLYGLDKAEAKRRGRSAQNRVPKLLLHLLALLGGFIGGWGGMFIFWHKIRQLEFWAVLIASTLLHWGISRFF
ncbi:MAG: DUF1294 domain-containing protein [Anaerolineae bacterium]|nr:DUF1294 domain-containing protein [Anaerolineae bacterium]